MVADIGQLALADWRKNKKAVQMTTLLLPLFSSPPAIGAK